MSFHLLIKFDPNKGSEQIALDYGVLGIENFQAIIDAYDNLGKETYATRENLGGIGDVDYLIVPQSYISNNVEDYKTKEASPIGYIIQGKDLYYIPINLIMFWNSPYFLAGYEIENSKFKQLDNENEFSKSIQEEIYRFFTKTIDESIQKIVRYKTVGIGDVHSGRKVVYPFLDLKNKMMSDFQSIINTRVDLIFTKDWLKYHMEWFLKENKSSIKAREDDILQYAPVFFKHLISEDVSSSELEFLVIPHNDKFYQLSKDRGDVKWAQVEYLLKDKRGLGRLIFTEFATPQWRGNVKLSNHYLYLEKDFDYSLKQSIRPFIQEMFLDKSKGVDFGKLQAKEWMEYILDKHFVIKGVGDIVSSQRMIGFQLISKEPKEPDLSDLEMSLKVLFLNTDGFLKYSEKKFSINDAIKSFFVLKTLPYTTSRAWFNPKNHKGEKFFQIVYLLNNCQSHMAIQKELPVEYLVRLSVIEPKPKTRLTEEEELLITKTRYLQSRFPPVLRVSEAASNVVRKKQNENFQLLFRDFSDEFKKVHSSFFDDLHKKLSNVFSFPKERDFRKVIFNLAFDTRSLSLNVEHNTESHGFDLVFQVDRNGQYATPKISEKYYNFLTEEQVLEYYTKLLEALFESQNVLNEKFGTIEYILEMTIIPDYRSDAEFSLLVNEEQANDENGYKLLLSTNTLYHYE